MAMDLSEATHHSGGTDLESLLLIGGLAMLFLGAGLVLSDPLLRRYRAKFGIGDVSATAPDETGPV